MGYEKVGDKDDKAVMTPGYSLSRDTKTKEIYYRFTHVSSRQGSGGRKKVALVAQAMGDKNCKSVQRKNKAMTIMEEAIRAGYVVIPGLHKMTSGDERLKDFTLRQLAVGSELYVWWTGAHGKKGSPKYFDKCRSGFKHHAYDLMENRMSSYRPFRNPYTNTFSETISAPDQYVHMPEPTRRYL